MSDNRVKLLDEGYIRIVECWGADERIIEAARMSTAKGFLGWGPKSKCKNCGDEFDDQHELGEQPRDCPNPSTGKPLVDCGTGGHMFVDEPGDEKLLKHLWDKQHSTPFEMAGMIVEVKAPIMVFREWHRHRTQCLGPDTLVHFDAPKSRSNRRFVYKLTIEEIWRRWQPTKRKDRPERQSNALWPRSRVQEMQLRCCNEELKEIQHTRIVDVIRGDPKPMIRVTAASGRQLTATHQHKVLTLQGWMPLGEAVELRVPLMLEGTSRGRLDGWEVPPPDTNVERWISVPGWHGLYEVSDAGRVRRFGCEPKRATIGSHGYLVVSLNRPGEQITRTVHSLVAEAFLGKLPVGNEVRHANHNRLDARLSNLSYGLPQDNANDRVVDDRNQRLVAVFEEIVSVENVGELPTFDLSVEGPWHNFIADGFVVHNSYNEMSARYIPLPNENYVPTIERVLLANHAGGNKQAQGAFQGKVVTEQDALDGFAVLAGVYEHAQQAYEQLLALGWPKELARLPVPVGRYSAMRASANLRNWFGFMKLRCDVAAQWEIRMYANAVAGFVKERFPRTYEVAKGSLGL